MDGVPLATGLFSVTRPVISSTMASIESSGLARPSSMDKTRHDASACSVKVHSVRWAEGLRSAVAIICEAKKEGDI